LPATETHLSLVRCIDSSSAKRWFVDNAFAQIISASGQRRSSEGNET
jgi:hypothetical protein